MKKAFVLLLGLLLFTGCAGKHPHILVLDFQERGIRSIAVLPVVNMSVNEKAGQVLRERILQELYFKGYPKMPLDIVDLKLSKAYQPHANSPLGVVPPRAAGELTGADALLYCTIEDLHTRFLFSYARTKITWDFELRSAKTGETLWRAGYKTTVNSYDISRARVEMKSHQIYEPALDEAMTRTMATFPNGPNMVK
jgi:hypothetical protein